MMGYLVTTLLLSTLWVVVLSNRPRDKLFFLEKSFGKDNRTLLVVTWADKGDEIAAGCEVFSDEELIKEVLKSSVDKHIRKISEDDMNILLEDCTEISMRRKRREIGGFIDEYLRDTYDTDVSNRDEYDTDRDDRDGLSRNNNNKAGYSRDMPGSVNGEDGSLNRDREGKRIHSNGEKRDTSNSVSDDNDINTNVTTSDPDQNAAPQWPIIWPGTKWCGSGDIAKNYDDLGLHEDTDRCCRAHDLCNDTILAGDSKYNLTNKSPFTALNCQCDGDFYNCLDRVNSVISNTIGNLYFNVLKRQCYREDYPLTKKCKKYKTFLKLICMEYHRDKKAPKVYQWISAKLYKNIPFPGPLTVTLPF